jgi:glycosyltransferase involved in cell wall biosynthesis
VPGRSDRRGLRLLVTVTFNDNQLRSHLLPILALDEVESVVLVADRPPAPLAKVEVVVPPAWLSRLVGRAVAKLAVCAVLAVRRRPDWVIGFNLVPHGLNAILSAALVRRQSMYEMIGGDREWREGGWDSDNGILGRLRGPSPFVERLLLAAVRRSSVVAVMGDNGRRSLLRRGLPAERVRVVPPTVDVERFSNLARPEPTIDIVTVAALLPNKRTADLLRAAALLLPRHPGLRVAVVGEGPLESALRRLARDLGLAGAVRFLGFRDDVDGIYRGARIFALTSEYEGLSIALLEAMACGTAPVVTEVGELADYVRDGETGRLVPVGDVDALARALGELLDDPAGADALGRAAAAEVRRRVAVPVVSSIYADLLCARR